MSQTLKATAAIIGIFAAAAIFYTAINMPLVDTVTETLTALVALCSILAILALLWYIINTAANILYNK